MVKIVFLGTAQDGGIPHFGCSCNNCNNALQDKKFQRNVASIAIVGEENVLLVDATPDIIKQQQLLKKMFPFMKYGFNSVLITHLHIGHYTGLVMFGKESAGSNKFPIYVTQDNFNFLRENKPFSYLFSRNNLSFQKISPGKIIILDKSVDIIPFKVPHRNEDGNTIGLEIISKKGNKKVIYIPDIDYLTDNIKSRIKKSDKVIFDGSFYSKGELIRQKEIPHPSITEVIHELGKQSENKFHFTHFNHTNPVLNPDSKEKKGVTILNYIIANDGDEIEL